MILIVKHQGISKVVAKVSKNWSKLVSFENINIHPKIEILQDRLKILQICNKINLINQHEFSHSKTINKILKLKLVKGKV